MGADTLKSDAHAPQPTPPPTVSMTPPGSSWAELVRGSFARSNAGATVRNFRLELGLPVDRPVVMSGHQSQWWHTGILAKQIALAAVCKEAGGDTASAWVVVDQDASDSLTLAYPTGRASQSLPTRGTWAIAPDALAAQLRADVAIADLPAFNPAEPPVDGATPDINRGLRAIADSAARWAGAANAAEQIARANAELVATLLGPPPALIFATTVLRTAAGRSMLERMGEDPARCVAAYNEAVKTSGVHTIAPLSAVPDKSRFELPLWQLSGKGNRPVPRRRVFASTLGDTPLDSLSPRGVLMTALFRWLGCDLFIHGTGGGATGEEGGYDKVAEHWMRLWLGVELSPSVVATATAYLPMGAASVATEADLAAAHRRVHDARHAPRTLSDPEAQREKDALVAQIAATTDRPERHRLYRQLQQHLERYRGAHASELGSINSSVSATSAELARQSILRERAWPWPILPRPLLLELQRTVESQMKG